MNDSPDVEGESVLSELEEQNEDRSRDEQLERDEREARESGSG